MQSTTPRPPPPRQRKPLEPVNVRAYFVGGATRQDLLDGAAVLSITDDGSTLEQAYWCESVFDGDRLVSFRLRKFNSADQHDLPANLSACDCPDGVYRSEPGGCRHMAALRQALPTVAKDASPPRPLDRKTDRDEATMPTIAAE